MRTLITTMLERELEPGVEASQLDPLAVERLDEINVPTLVIIGDGDVHEIVRTADLLAQSIAGARKVVIPNVAHVPNLERPEEINQLVLDFLAVELTEHCRERPGTFSAGESPRMRFPTRYAVRFQFAMFQ